MSASEGVKAKARDYLSQGRVKVIEVSGNHGHFEVSGSGAEPYTVKHGSEWTCTCGSRILVCSHVFACQLLTNFSKEQALFSSNTSELMAFLNGDS